MKKVIRLINTLFLAISIFILSSCSNDSVDNSAPTTQPQPENNPSESVIKDGIYEVTLTPYINLTTFNEVEYKNKEIVVTDGKLKPIPRTKSKIENCKIGNGEYFNYSFEMPKDLKDKIPKEVIGKGIVLSRNEITDKKMNIVVSDGGKKITYDWKKIDFIGSNIKILTFEILNLTNESKQNILFKPYDSNKTKDYVGSWEYVENNELKYTLIINDNLTGIYMFGSNVGDFTIDDKPAWGLELIDNTSKKTIGKVAKVFEKLNFMPDKSFEGIKENITFSKKLAINN